MAEIVWGLLYHLVAAIGRLIGFFVSELLANAISSKIEDFFTIETKLEKHVKMLSGEKWFDALMKDYRYSYIVVHNKRVGRYLRELSNIHLLLKHEEERGKFIEMVKQEHMKFASGTTTKM